MTTTQTQTNNGAKLVAKCATTGLYFNGTNFGAATAADALALRPGTVAEDFKLSWSAPVEIETIGGEESLAMRIHKGELDRHEAAAEYVRKTRRENGQKEFMVRTPAGKYVSRRVNEPKTGIDRSAWVKFQGCEVALIWSRGELAIDSL